MRRMAVNPNPAPQSLSLRLLRRILSRRRGETKAMADALRLQHLLRFIVLLAVTILLPSVLLAYFGVNPPQSDGPANEKELQVLADGTAATLWNQMGRPFVDFEVAVRTRLSAGQSPLEGANQLHPDLVVALKLNSELEIEDPFFRDGHQTPEPVDFLFDHQANVAATLERQGGDPMVVARLYGKAARAAKTRQAKARFLFDRVRMLSEAGRVAEANQAMGDLEDRYRLVRDPWGFRILDLVRLKQAEGLLVRDKKAGARALRLLVEDMIKTKWTVGYGGEPAVARRALSRLEDSEWVAATRSRIDDRGQMLYWTERLLPELDPILEGRRVLQVNPGKFRWVGGEDGLWAITFWGENLYAFALDKEKVIRGIREAAAGMNPADSLVLCSIVSPDQDGPAGLLRERGLSPWLPGWSLMVAPRDPGAVAEGQEQQRRWRMGTVLIAVLLIGVGALATARLVSNELQNARMKADFAANVSHELRSPITQIRLKAEGLLYGLSETAEERHHDYQTIVRESERLSRLVDNVLDFSAIERGAKRYALVPGDLVESVRQALEMVASSAEVQSRDLEIKLDPDLPVVDHDPDAVAQCVINLVSNAAKYSAADQPIRVRARRLGGGAKVEVTDFGIGIPTGDLQQIFEAFYRGGDKLVRQKKGTGIGLAITQYIMQAHEGRVEVVSTPGEGSAFSLWFPRSSSAHPDHTR